MTAMGVSEGTTEKLDSVTAESDTAPEALPSVNASGTALAMDTQQGDKIIQQISFYFSEVNLAHDKFLTGKISENKEGWVSISTLSTFSRMKQLTAVADVSAVSARILQAIDLAYESSQKGSILPSFELNEARTMVRKKGATMGESGPRNILKSTIYVKGFNKSDTLEDIQSYMTEVLKESGWDGKKDDKASPPASNQAIPFAVRMRRTSGKSRDFKGSVFIECLTEGLASHLSTVLKEKTMPNSTEKPLVYTKEFYLELKNDQYKSKGKAGKRKNENGDKEEAEGEREAQALSTDASALSFKFTPNCLIKLASIPSEHVGAIQQHKLKQQIASDDHVNVAFIELSSDKKRDEGSDDKPAGYIRLKEPKASELVEKYQSVGGLSVSLKEQAGSDAVSVLCVDLALPSKEEEKAYYAKLAEHLQSSQGGKRGRGGKGGRRGHKRSRY